jgi:O-antigen/teichoic acid export membrane protein
MLLLGSRGFLLALLLGPESYGTLGALIVIQQLLGYAALGVREGVLVELSPRALCSPENLETYSSSLAFAAFIGVLLPLALGTYSLVAHDKLDTNYLLCALIGTFSVVNDVLVNLNRYEGNLLRVSFCETTYNFISLSLIFLLRDSLTVALAQGTILVALLFSVVVYLFHLKYFSLRAVTLLAMKRLVGIGIFTAMLSAVLMLVNVTFILLAQRHLAKVDVGHYVFANNIATLLLVSLNAFSWAMTSRTIGEISQVSDDEKNWQRVLRTDVFLRVGVALAVLCALCIALVLPYVFERYTESTRYLLFCVVLQSFPLIAFTELNFLMLRRKVVVAVLILGAASIVNFAMIDLLAGTLSFELTTMIAIVIVGLAMIGIMRYASSEGFEGTHLFAKLASTGGLLLMAVINYAFGLYVVLACALLFFLAVIRFNWQVLRPA